MLKSLNDLQVNNREQEFILAITNLATVVFKHNILLDRMEINDIPRLTLELGGVLNKIRLIDSNGNILYSCDYLNGFASDIEELANAYEHEIEAIRDDFVFNLNEDAKAIKEWRHDGGEELC